MKKNLWIILAAAITTGLYAQDATNSAPVLQAPPPEPTSAPPPVTESMPAMPGMEAPTNAPTTTQPKKAKTVRRKTTRRATVAHRRSAAPELRTVPLVPGPAVVSATHVNVRSRAGLAGEVLTHVTNGEPVTVIEEVHLKKSGPDEPSAWAKIALPGDTHVWIKSSLLDTNNAVLPKRVNLRAGPGENYGVLGTVERGESVQVIDTKSEWSQIQAPTNAYAFVAAQYLKQEEGGATVAAATPTPETTPTATTTMPEMPTMAPPAGGTPGMTTDTNNNNTTATTEMPATPTMTPATPEPPPERIVAHEGLVRGTFSIQAPTHFELISLDTHEPVDYLYTTSTNLDLSQYKGMHIIVTGEEAIDPRWGNTPVITIHRIQVLE